MNDDMILSVEEAIEACRNVEAMVDMKLISSADCVVTQTEIMARAVPMGAAA